MTGWDEGEPAAEPAAGGQVLGVDVASLTERLEIMLLEGPRKYTREQFAEAAGTTTEKANHLWRALGFATVADDEVIFTDRDIRALHTAEYFVDSTGGDDVLLSAMARLLGRMFARVASWQGELMYEAIASQPQLLGSEEKILEFAETMMPVLEETQSYVWRRQLAGYLSRIATHMSPEVAAPGTAPTVVGFADLSGFTSLARRASESELRAVLEAFETIVTEVVGEHNGRIVKTIGDEILFVCDTEVGGAEIALDLVATVAADEQLPQLRVGMAAGPVVNRLGDVYGSTVNIASRLTTISRPGWVLVDRIMAEALRDNPVYALKARRAESVRGYHHLRQWRLRRVEDVPDTSDIGGAERERGSAKSRVRRAAAHTEPLTA